MDFSLPPTSPLSSLRREAKAHGLRRHVLNLGAVIRIWMKHPFLLGWRPSIAIGLEDTTTRNKKLLGAPALLLGARTLGAPGRTTSSILTTRNEAAGVSAWVKYPSHANGVSVVTSLHKVATWFPCKQPGCPTSLYHERWWETQVSNVGISNSPLLPPISEASAGMLLKIGGWWPWKRMAQI